MENKKYPIQGYAPGPYQNRCADCKQLFFGDKRALQCEPCAIKWQQFLDGLTPEQLKVFEKDRQEIFKLFMELRDLKAASQPIGSVSQDAHEKEVMMKAFDKVRDLFEKRSWIMEGRGSYPYNDDRYKQEVRYMYDEFDALFKDTWANIKSKSFEYRQQIIEQYLKENPPIGAVWVKGEYDRLYDQVKGGKRTVCFVDYRYGHVDQEQVCRDICTIDNEGWEFFARGIRYGRLSYAMKKYGMAQDSAFVKICEEMNVEWLDESPTAAGETEETIFDQYRAIKEKIGKLGYNTFINSIEVEQYREWLRNDRYKHRIEWFEKEYPNGLYSKDDDGELFGVNIMTKKFLAEADAAYDKPTAAGDGKEDAVAFGKWLKTAQWQDGERKQAFMKNDFEKLYTIFKQSK